MVAEEEVCAQSDQEVGGETHPSCDIGITEMPLGAKEKYNSASVANANATKEFLGFSHCYVAQSMIMSAPQASRFSLLNLVNRRRDH